jgi:hypothetical protein
MTPEQKAKELYDKFIRIDGVIDEVLPHTIAKQCAIICVDEIIRSFAKIYDDDMGGRSFDELLLRDVEYFKEVKTEIEKL